MTDEKTFVSDSNFHVHLWVHNNGNNPAQTKWTLAITESPTEPFSQNPSTIWTHTGVFGNAQAEAVDKWLKQNRCGGMFLNLRHKLVSFANSIQGSSK